MFGVHTIFRSLESSMKRKKNIVIVSKHQIFDKYYKLKCLCNISAHYKSIFPLIVPSSPWLKGEGTEIGVFVELSVFLNHSNPIFTVWSGSTRFFYELLNNNQHAMVIFFTPFSFQLHYYSHISWYYYALTHITVASRLCTVRQVKILKARGTFTFMRFKRDSNSVLNHAARFIQNFSTMLMISSRGRRAVPYFSHVNLIHAHGIFSFLFLYCYEEQAGHISPFFQNLQQFFLSLDVNDERE